MPASNLATGQWLPYKTTTLASATASFGSPECVWARANVGKLGSNVSFDMCTHAGAYDRHLSRIIQLHGCVECDDVAFTVEALRTAGRGAKLLDLGANIGMYSLPALAAGFSVVAFEPMPANAIRLLASARRNGMQSKLHLVALCVSDQPAGPLCHLGLNPTNQGHLRHQVGANSAGNGTDSGAADTGLVGASGLLTSAAVRVDDVLAPQSAPLVLKIDLEGSECRAFRGMRRLLNASRQVHGAVVEFDKISSSHECCEELIRPPHGAFYLLHHRHGLCAYPGGKRSHASLDFLCHLPPVPGSKQLNLRWKPCAARDGGSSL